MYIFCQWNAKFVRHFSICTHVLASLMYHLILCSEANLYVLLQQNIHKYNFLRNLEVCDKLLHFVRIFRVFHRFDHHDLQNCKMCSRFLKKIILLYEITFIAERYITAKDWQKIISFLMSSRQLIFGILMILIVYELVPTLFLKP